MTTTVSHYFVRDEVAKTYARVSAPASGPALAGYSDEDLAALPPGAAGEFFGCGNPLSFVAVRPGDTVLDLGSGAGVDLVLAARRVGPEGHVIGVDMTDVMIDRARRNVAAGGFTNVEIRKGLIEKLPVDDSSVDWVISNCVISLSPEKDRVFAEVARVLRPGGRMLVSDIVVDEALALLLTRLTRVVPSIAHARTEDAYLATMARAGLVDLAVEDRFLYERDHLLGMFGGEENALAAAACPIASFRGRLLSRPLRLGLALGARVAAGHVWSSKLSARRPLEAGRRMES
jgi:arsenite methyltransferase